MDDSYSYSFKMSASLIRKKSVVNNYNIYMESGLLNFVHGAFSPMAIWHI